MSKEQTNHNNADSGFMVVEWLITAFIVLLILAIFFVRLQLSNGVVSGIVYNTSHDSLIGGNTHFSVRAGENTPVTKENESKFCLPPNSPYKELIIRAAKDKRVKVEVESKQHFSLQAPWVCVNNVVVAEVK
jgi:hypothetical protein